MVYVNTKSILYKKLIFLGPVFLVSITLFKLVLKLFHATYELFHEIQFKCVNHGNEYTNMKIMTLIQII